MSRVKSKNTKPEVFVFEVLDKLGIKYQKHFSVAGTPDVAFPDLKVAVFINGEFWHGRRFRIEKNSYKEFWVNKISTNIIRDRNNYSLLKSEGWKVIKIWDKEVIKHPKRELNKIMEAIGRPSVLKSDLQI